LVEFPLDVLNFCSHGQFSRDGLHLAWGNTDGTVSLLDLKEIQRRLAAVGLGW
jgi:hypothetical protein